MHGGYDKYIIIRHISKCFTPLEIYHFVQCNVCMLFLVDSTYVYVNNLTPNYIT